MTNSRTYLISALAELGERLKSFGADDATQNIVSQAIGQNSWFTGSDILAAVEAIRTQMLDAGKLRQWLAPYPEPDVPRTVGVIMAGNIPLVGFFDMLCVVVSGHRCLYKPSSKDSVLIDYFVATLKDIAPEIAIERYEDQTLDAVIATGSDNTNRYFRSKYGDIPSILRGSRASVAVLDGTESREQLAGLAGDIFSYNGLGCRNISHLFIPEGYDFGALIEAAASTAVNPKYLNNYKQNIALLRMQGSEYTNGGFFVLRAGTDFPTAISEITYQHYTELSEVEQWLCAHDSQIQCVEGNVSHPRGVGFGQAQSPTLTDYPDAIDVLGFLANIR